MARRFCGSIVIRLQLDNTNTMYRCRMPGYACIVGVPASGYGPGISYDSPEAYDQAARAALSFAMNDGALDGSGMDMDEHGRLLIKRDTERRESVHLQAKGENGRELPRSWCGRAGTAFVDHFLYYQPDRPSKSGPYYACRKCWARWVSDKRYAGFHSRTA